MGAKTLKWDEAGERLYETGVSHGVLYPMTEGGVYGPGVAWNGLTGVTASPSGAEPTALYANDIKYLELRSAEEFGMTITAYTYPDEFAECDGSATIAKGVHIGQQNRKGFGFSYQVIVGNDTKENDYGKKIYLVYGCKASPSERDHTTVNDSPEAVEMSWEVSTTPVEVGNGHKPTSSIEIDCTVLKPETVKAVEDMLYGDTADPKLPTPAELITLINSKEASEAA